MVKTFFENYARRDKRKSQSDPDGHQTPQNQMSYNSSARKHRLYKFLLPSFFDHFPIQIFHESFQIARPIGPIIQHESVLKNIHIQEEVQAGRMTVIVLVDPKIHQLAIFRIAVEGCPTDAAHFGCGQKIILPCFIAAETFFHGGE